MDEYRERVRRLIADDYPKFPWGEYTRFGAWLVNDDLDFIERWWRR